MNKNRRAAAEMSEDFVSPHALILVHFPEGEGQFMLHVSSFSVASHKMYAKVYANRLLFLKKTHGSRICLHKRLKGLNYT